MHRILIIDDNHSFVDALKEALREFSFQYDSTFRLAEAEAKLTEKGSFIHIATALALREFAETAARSGDTVPEVPKLSADPLNTGGYFLIILEQDTEINTKGLQFIEKLTRPGSDFSSAQFILFTSKPSALESKAAAMGVAVLEKPVRYPALKTLVQQKIRELESFRDQTNDIIRVYGIKPAGDKSAKRTRTAKSSGATEKPAAKSRSTGTLPKSSSKKAAKKADSGTVKKAASRKKGK